MTAMVALVVGYLIGSTPTANALARLQGIDLRSDGSGNPGTNNARKLGGYRLAAAVLVVEMLKGVAAAGSGLLMGDETSAVLAALGAVTGNVYNVWYRFGGGKGLAIGGGVLLTLWPVAFILAVALIASLATLTKSSGKAAIAALVGVVAMGVLWWQYDYSNPWGVEDTSLLPILAVGMALAIMPKHFGDARTAVKTPSRPLP